MIQWLINEFLPKGNFRIDICLKYICQMLFSKVTFGIQAVNFPFPVNQTHDLGGVSAMLYQIDLDWQKYTGGCEGTAALERHCRK